MKVAIMGCGPGGSYLYCLLKRRKPEVEVELFDVPHATRCGIQPCGWAVSFPLFHGLLREIALVPDRYVLGRYGQMVIDGIRLRANIAVIDKPLLIKHMLANESPQKIPVNQLDKYDRVIDATGQRAFLPSCEVRVIEAIENRVKVGSLVAPAAFLNNNSWGYSWLIPLGNGEAHFGSLSLRGAAECRRELERLRTELSLGPAICACQGQIWSSGAILPFTHGNVWGLGQSIGLVEPMSGAGITPAMDSARIMVENWDDPVSYEKVVLSRYSSMVRMAQVVHKLVRGEAPTILDAFLSRGASNIVGIYPGITGLIRLVRKIKDKVNGYAD